MENRRQKTRKSEDQSRMHITENQLQKGNQRTWEGRIINKAIQGTFSRNQRHESLNLKSSLKRQQNIKEKKTHIKLDHCECIDH